MSPKQESSGSNVIAAVFGAVITAVVLFAGKAVITKIDTANVAKQILDDDVNSTVLRNQLRDSDEFLTALAKKLLGDEPSLKKLLDAMAARDAEFRGHIGPAGPGCEIGSIHPWPGKALPKSGDWMFCNGDAVSRVDYEALFDVIGVGYGAGDGTTTFNLPDYRGYFLRGAGIPTKGPMAETAQRSTQTEREVGTYQSDDVGLLAQLRDPDFIREQERAGNSRYEMLWGDGTRIQQVIKDGATRFEYLPVTGGFTEIEKHRRNNWGFETRPANAAVHFIIRVK